MKTKVYGAFVFAIAVGSAHADSLALVASDASGFVSGAQTALLATGKFKNVDFIDVTFSTPTLADLSGYTDILAWTNNFPANGVALGNVLADFYDLGGKHVTIATFALTNPGGINGRIMSGAYAALVNAGTYANPSGSLTAMLPTDPVFAGITLGNVTYYHNRGFAHPGLGTGTALLSGDGAGINMIARSSNGVVNINLYPGLGAGSGGVDNNQEFYNLVANTFASPVTDTIPPTTTATVLPAPNAKGWNNSNVSVSLTAVDDPGGSGVKQINITLSGAQTASTTVPGASASIPITAEGSTTITYSSTDNAGNIEAAKTVTVLLDETAPAATATVNPVPNASGWNDTNVTVAFSGTDTLSGIASCTAPVTLTANGAGQIVTGTCTDNAGNVSAPVSKSINIDKTAPVIAGVPAAGTCVLWPPSNQLVQVATISVQPGYIATFDVTGASNQPPQAGQTDIVITGTGLEPRAIQLRAQRSGRLGARIYTITATASNPAGDTNAATFTCTVPHDQRTEDEQEHENAIR